MGVETISISETNSDHNFVKYENKLIKLVLSHHLNFDQALSKQLQMF